ncbi:MAG: hypothetical protein HQL94_07350 [Magnetococcales bacterium]|nr:hypothetical protein [Magnetococcales bacterium]MBF0438481.1 hypothetical protein [Magnetococcales bacterium]
MFNAIPAINLFGASNPLLEQSNLAKLPHEIRTQNSERLTARNVEELKKNAKARQNKRKHDEDEDDSDGEEDAFSQPQPRHQPTIQERLKMANLEKVSLNQRAVNELFLQQARGGGVYPAKKPREERPSIDLIA